MPAGFTRPREKIAPAAASIAIVAAIGWILVKGLSAPVLAISHDALVTLTLTPPPPVESYKPKPKPKPKLQRQRASRAASAAARPKPAPSLTVQNPPVLQPMPLTAIAPPAGGPVGMGQGLGAGSGSGSGAGGAGGDGDGADDTPPLRLKGRLGFSDLPEGLRIEGRELAITVRYAVNIDGHVSDCAATRSSGDRQLDNHICRLIETRFRFEPSRDGAGNPVRAMMEEDYSWRLRRAGEE
jgi:protein TonB